METMTIKPVQKVEITTLEDNFIDLTSGDNSSVVKRGRPAGKTALAGSILAEHGFSAFIKVGAEDRDRAMLMDFGLSDDVAARNAKTLGMDLSQVETAVLSHGHRDHFGGLAAVAAEMNRKGVAFVAHPSAFKPNRFIFLGPDMKIPMASADAAEVSRAGFKLVTSEKPMPLLDGHVLFLGEVPRKTAFEQGMPNAACMKEGRVEKDILEDDTAVVLNLAEKGLVVLSGCAHSGIINTVRHAREVTGISKVHAIMGGFHLSGPVFEPIIQDTVAALKEMAPDYIIPTHCTGRRAINAIEAALPGAFILNMSGTTLTFRSSPE